MSSNFVKLDDPASLPTSYCSGLTFSNDNIYLVAAHISSPYISIFKRNSDTFNKLDNPGTLPAGASRVVSFTPDGIYLAIVHSNSPYITIYKRNGDVFDKLPNPSTLPIGNGYCTTFSPDGNYLVVGHDSSPYITIYKRNGDTFTKLSNPASLPPVAGRGVAFSPDSIYLAVTYSNSPYVTIYKRDGDTFTKLSDPSVLPANSGHCIAFSSNGSYLAIGHNSIPYVTIYKRNGDTFTKLSNPTTLPTSECWDVSFSSDDKYLAVTHYSSPYVTLYERDGDTFNKIDNPAVLPAGIGYSVAFSSDSTYLVVGHGTSPYMTIYKDITKTAPNAPNPIEPIGKYLDNGSIIQFEWQYSSITGGTQSAFDLQYSTDDGTTWITVSQTTSNTFYEAPADTFPTGNIYWRVACYNEYGIVGPYSDTQVFYAVGAPQAPVLQGVIGNTARPTVSWSSTGQQVWQVQIIQSGNIVYDTGWMGAAVNTHKITAFLDEGMYTAQVRVKNEYDLASDWGTNDFTVSTVKPGLPILTVSNINYGLNLAISNIDIAAYVLIYRAEGDIEDTICIGKVYPADPTYNDYAVASGKTYRYFARAVTEGEAYSDSAVGSGTAVFKNSIVYAISDPANTIDLKVNLNAIPNRIHYVTQVETAVHYSGRKYPVMETSEHTDSSLSLGFYLENQAELERLIELCERKETVLYRDNRGRKMYGRLNSLSVKDIRPGFSINFVLNQVDFIEELEV